ncbi:MAG: NfeD family protein [Myxacorys californica WJT36-NPBG1]|jgi:membrane protein implicated in regulation of membrane protease activity|nr:NfeD family protein [Myxacorys californica WJT36-NPBG1]
MVLNPTMVWLVAGAILCLVELILPTAFIAFVMGLSAIAVAAVSTVLPLNLQIFLWIVLSVLLVVLSRRLVKRKAALRLDATEAEALTEILPGENGRVLYEGNSWAARCEDTGVTISAHQRVYVVGRKGTTLLVLPHEF